MKLSDIIKSQEEAVMDEVLKCEPSFEIKGLRSCEDGYTADVTKEINGYIYPGQLFLDCREDIADKVTKTERFFNYIAELWTQYPELCHINEVLQKYRVFTVKDIGTVRLCRQLILPNRTECGFGGGDYEIKRTPQRAKEFLQNIDKFTVILSRAVVELQEIKAKYLAETSGHSLEV